MALSIQDKETEKLATKVAQLAGEQVDEAVKTALRERHDRLESPQRGERRRQTKEELLRFMETEIWPLIPAELRGRPPMTKAERAKLLGYGPDDD